MKARKTISILSLLLIFNLFCLAQQSKTETKSPPPNTKVPVKKTAAGSAAKANPNDRYFFYYALDDIYRIEDGNGKVILESAEDEAGYGGGLTKETPGYPTAIWIDGENTDGSEIGWGFMDDKHKIIIPMIYAQTDGFAEGLAAVSLPDGGDYGFIDKTGKTIIPFNFDIAHNFSEGLARVLKSHGGDMDYQSGFIDKKGFEVIPYLYNVASDFKEGLAAVQLNGKCGYIDKTGKVVIPLIYDGANDFSEGIAIVNKGCAITSYSVSGWGGKSAIINREGKELTDFKYHNIGDFRNGLAQISTGIEPGFKYGMLDKSGKEVIPATYSQIYSFSSGYYIVLLNKKYGIIDSTGTTVLSLKYDDIKPEGWEGTSCKIKIDRHYGFVNLKGQVIVPPVYDSVGGFYSNQLSFAKKDDKYGFINQANNVVIPFQYDEAGDFGDGLAAVRLKGKYGFIDETGKVVIPLIYEAATGFTYGNAEVTLNGKEIIIDTKGKQLP